MLAEIVVNDKPVDLGGLSSAQGSSPWRQRHDACSGRNESQGRVDRHTYQKPWHFDSEKGISCPLKNLAS